MQKCGYPTIVFSEQNVFHSRARISTFFSSLDLFLSPSIREGGNIALQEAIWHGVPFLTTDAPGGKILADIFGCPALPMNEFAFHIMSGNTRVKPSNYRQWTSLIKTFESSNVEKEFVEILTSIISHSDKPKTL